MNQWVPYLLAFILTTILTGIVRRYALRHDIVDLPNARSSHKVPTPRGGGVAFVAVSTALSVWAFWTKQITLGVFMAIVGGGLAVAVIGWLDDRYRLSVRIRALVHAGVALWALLWLGGMPLLDLGLVRVHLGFIGLVGGVLGIVWMINLFNFMDGIDGLAASETVIVASVSGLLLWGERDNSLATVAWLLAATSAGFLVWNWAPARIFMGDVGSGFLGYSFAVLAIASEKEGALPLLAWGILLGVFLVDATLTLLRRMIQGERWYEAHRSHVYQLAVQAGYSHSQVSLAVAAINLFLSVLTYLALMSSSNSMLVTLASLGALSLLWLSFRKRFSRNLSTPLRL